MSTPWVEIAFLRGVGSSGSKPPKTERRQDSLPSHGDGNSAASQARIPRQPIERDRRTQQSISGSWPERNTKSTFGLLRDLSTKLP
jgi:hypothetical protein